MKPMNDIKDALFVIGLGVGWLVIMTVIFAIGSALMR